VTHIDGKEYKEARGKNSKALQAMGVVTTIRKNHEPDFKFAYKITERE